MQKWHGIAKIYALTSFDTFKISKNTLDAIRDMGFTEASEIQGLAIPPLLQGKDIIGQAQTGTGKTAAFLLPVMHKIISGPQNNKIKALKLLKTLKHLKTRNLLKPLNGSTVLSMSGRLVPLTQGAQSWQAQ